MLMEALKMSFIWFVLASNLLYEFSLILNDSINLTNLKRTSECNITLYYNCLFKKSRNNKM